MSASGGTTMSNRVLANGIALDLLTSVLATAAVFLAAVATHVFTDMRELFLGMALLFAIVGFGRGRCPPANRWLKALLLVSLCMLVLGFASGAPALMLGLIVGISYAAALVGISGRRGWATNRTRSTATMGTVLAAIGMGSVFGAPVLASRLATHPANRPIPEFSVTRLDGAVVNSSEFKGRVVVLDFWATWCTPCRQEFPELERLYQRYHANPDVTFLAIDVNRESETPDKAREFMQKAGYTIPAAYDANDAVARLKAEGYPHLLLLDKSGHVRLEHVGYDGAERFVENLAREIDKLLSEPQRAPLP